MDALLSTLVANNVVTFLDAKIIHELHSDTALPVEQLLLQNGLTNESVLANFSDSQVECELSPERFVPDIEAIEIVSEATARRFGVLALSLDRQFDCLTLVAASYPSLPLRDAIVAELPTTLTLNWLKATAADVQRCLDVAYGVCWQLDSILEELDGQSLATIADDSPDSLFGGMGIDNSQGMPPPAVRLVDALLHDACRRRASDIHLCPELNIIRVRYRVDGVLMTARSLARRYWPALIVRLKVLANMDIAESRLPQDGHISRQINGRHMDFRLASFPVQNGENLVLRVLDRGRYLRSLDGLGLQNNSVDALRNAVRQPQGLIVVCGPTGSGKTTTLYALLQVHDAEKLNVMTLEDPVEYPLPHVRQTAVGKVQGFDFAAGVRGVLRQDPDVLLVGEIRDAKSCQMVMRAVMTGHQVMTTVHANDVFGAIQRLLELGANQSVLANHLNAIVAQRLVRRRCHACNTESVVMGERGRSQCSLCAGTGLYERMALLEHLQFDARLRSALLRKADIHTWMTSAKNSGFKAFSELASTAVAMGATTRDEVCRVFGDEVIQ